MKKILLTNQNANGSGEWINLNLHRYAAASVITIVGTNDSALTVDIEVEDANEEVISLHQQVFSADGKAYEKLGDLPFNKIRATVSGYTTGNVSVAIEYHNI